MVFDLMFEGRNRAKKEEEKDLGVFVSNNFKMEKAIYNC